MYSNKYQNHIKPSLFLGKSYALSRKKGLILNLNINLKNGSKYLITNRKGL
jgi:hypothetical protein